jgi:YVTN family beta-propeller protein
MVLANLSVGQNPSTMTYDPTHGYVYVANLDSGNVSVVAGTRVIASIPVGNRPVVGAVDQADGTVYVSNYGDGNVSVINGTHVTGSVNVGPGPEPGAYNSRFGWVYIPNSLSNTVSVVSGTTELSKIAVCDSTVCNNNGALGPFLAMYEPGSSLVYVAQYGTGSTIANVSVVTGGVLLGVVTVGMAPDALAFDGVVYVANGRSGNVSVLFPGLNFSGSVFVGAGPDSMTADPLNGYVYVSNGDSNTVSVISGLSVVATIPVGKLPRSVAFDSENGLVYVSNLDSGNVSVISGTNLVATIPVGRATDRLLYDSGNGFLYLTSEFDRVYVLGPPAPTIVAFDASPSILTLGQATTLQVSASNGSNPLSYVYSGLPPGCASENSSWLSCMPSSAGSYTVTVNVSDLAGRVATKTLPLSVVPPLSGHFGVTFVENGLPAGTSWSVTLNGTSESTTSNTVLFTVPNGTYSYSIGTVARYAVAPASGAIEVFGSSQNVGLTFTAIPAGRFLVTFTETGLPTATTWSVTLGGNTESSPGGSLQYLETNGSYPFAVGSVAGYSASPSSGTVSVEGHPDNQSVAFQASPSLLSSTITVSAWELYAIIGTTAVLGALFVLSEFRRRSRGSTTHHLPPEPPPPG